MKRAALGLNIFFSSFFFPCRSPLAARRVSTQGSSLRVVSTQGFAIGAQAGGVFTRGEGTVIFCVLDRLPAHHLFSPHAFSPPPLVRIWSEPSYMRRPSLVTSVVFFFMRTLLVCFLRGSIDEELRFDGRCLLFSKPAPPGRRLQAGSSQAEPILSRFQDISEVGSDSMQGAGAPTMFQAMRRIVDCLTHERMTESYFERAIRSSFLVSADMAHGLHPNFPDKYEEHHRPQLQKGVVIKHNANQRYATSALTAFLFREVANIHDLPVQEFVVRNDMGCGSTIGPILASGVGIRTVDCGIPQLSMHSVREVCGKEDVDIAYKLFKAFFKSFSHVDKKLNVDF